VRIGLVEHPLVQAVVDAVAERCVPSLIRSGDEPVD
jgi:hypothetical protein